MVIDKSGKWWTGTESADLSEYLKEFQAGGYEVMDVVVVPSCSACGSPAGYRLRLDGEEGYADAYALLAPTPTPCSPARTDR